MSKQSRRAARAAARQSGAATAPGAAPTTRAGTRAGRRERSRPSYSRRRSFLERYRTPILWAAGLAVVGLVGAFFLMGATAPSYICGSQWQPAATPVPSAGTSPRLGFVQPDMGKAHNPPRPIRYQYCPPASGSHYAAPFPGPITPRLYGPEEPTDPPGWIHNLEHGGIVVLYRGQGEAVTDAGQQRLRDFFSTFPNSPLCGLPPGQNGAGLVVTRFDDMQWPYAALVWDRVLPLDSWDADKVREFFRTEGERSNPEPQCARPTPSPGVTPSPSPSGSPGASGSPAASGSPTTSPSAS